MKFKIILTLFTLMLSGCQSTQLKPYDESGFKLASSTGEKYKVTLITGNIKIGHSDWITASAYENGKNPTYYCAEQGRHEWMGESWMFTIENQLEASSHLIEILKANGIYNESSSNEIVLNFISVAQGPQDQPVYTFEIELSTIKSGQLTSKSSFTVTGNDMSEEFWTTDSWAGAKKRATNRLLTKVIEQLDQKLAGGGI